MLISLATIGFTIAGILFLIYALSFKKAATASLEAKLATYSHAYLFLGVAFLFWGIVTLIPSSLQLSVIIGDTLILLGSLCLLDFLLSSNQKTTRWTAITLGSLIAIGLVWLRSAYFFPIAAIDNGILIFNTQLPVAITLILVFLFIWLPANLKAARLVGHELNDKAMQSIYSYIYVFSTIAAILFISVKTPTIAIVAFVMLGICFIMLLYSNFIQKKLYKEIHERK